MLITQLTIWSSTYLRQFKGLALTITQEELLLKRRRRPVEFLVLYLNI